jgi:prevent-host-death family protein
MPSIGVRELKAKASEILRNVRERKVRYLVTYHGRSIAALIPLEDVEAAEPDEAAWQELIRLGDQIGRSWKVEASSAELLEEMRR